MKAKSLKILALVSLLGVLVYAVTVEPIETKVVPADGASQDYFGDSVALEGDTLVVGTSLQDRANQDAGVAYVYVHDDTGWVQQQKLVNNQTEGFLFGSAVAISGETLVVGCPYNYSGNDALGGAAFIYVRNAGQWTLQQIVSSPAAYDGDGFGYAATLSGDTLVVGAPPDMGWFSSGAAYVFVRQGTTWTLQQTLVGDDAQAGATMGVAVALSTNSNFAAVGAIGDGSAPGAVYLFNRSGNVWTQTQKLAASDASVDDGFGLSLGLNRDSLIVGAPRNSTRGDHMGAAYVFAQAGTMWTEAQKIEDLVGKAFDQFGHSVAISGDRLVVGSVSGNTAIADTGSADVYARSNSLWSLKQKLAPVDLRAQDVFGHSVTMSKSRIAVSALQFFNFKPGAVYVYQLEEPDTTPPVVQCSAAQTVSADANGKAALPDFASLATATDDRTPTAELVRSQGPVAGTVLGLGNYPVTVQVTDGAGNVGSCTTSFTVVDTTPPSVSVPQRLTASADGNCQSTIPDLLAHLIASDNCTASGALLKIQEPAAGTVVNSGSTSIKVTVTDESGNSASASSVLVVSDTTAPVFVAPGGVTVSANNVGKAAVANFVANLAASDNCTAANALLKVQSPSAGTLVGVGSTPVTITVTDAAGNSASASTLFTVVDTSAPVIAPLSAVTVSANSQGKAAVADFLANLAVSDNVTPASALLKVQSPAAGTLVGVGATPVTVTVTDAAGNSASASTSFTVVDTSAPAIAPLSAATASANSQGKAAVADFVANLVVSDNVTPANALVKVQSPSAGTLVGVGSTLVTVTVTDGAGNSTSASTSFTVVDTTPPSVVAPASVTAATDSMGRSVVPNILGQLVVSDNVTAPADLVASQSPAAGTLADPSLTAIVVTVRDQAGNSATATTALVRGDTTPPVITAASVSPSLIQKVNGKMIPVTVSVSATDNSDPAPTTRILCITSDQGAGATDRTSVDWEITGDLTANLRAEVNGKGDPRNYTIKLQCTDRCGNSSTASLCVTVRKDAGNSTALTSMLIKGKDAKDSKH